MFNYKKTLDAMVRERTSRQAEVDKLDQAIAALQRLVGKSAPARTPSLSVQTLRRISQAQKKRWAKVKQGANANQESTNGPKISAQGLRNIRKGQRRRWAKVRAAAKAKSKAA